MISNRLPRQYTDEEILASVLGTLPSKIIDNIYNMMTEVFYEVNNGISDCLFSLSPDKTGAITDVIITYEKQVDIQLDKAFNTLQQYLHDNIWKIPPGLDIKLKQDKGIDMDLTEDNEKLLDDQLEELRNKTMGQRVLNTRLLMENNRLDKELQSLDKLNEIMVLLSEQDTIDISNTLKVIENQLNNFKGIVNRTIHDTFKKIQSIPNHTEYNEQLKQRLREEVELFRTNKRPRI
ncbi:hypothetical protein BDB01DRAFT_769771 [Pilobolus umbonatus]|nr:hypothetical protein BDB01DRAFT_769771 [Pilobolus umbonatus]